jgi:hypothetical protein
MRITGVATAFCIAGTGLSVFAGPAAADLAKTTDTFCGELQRSVTGATVPAATVVHPDYESFKASKAEVRPLRTEQFVVYEDAAKQHPKLVSCKLKSADIIIKEYGDGAAKDGPVACSDIHREMFGAVTAAMSPAETAALKIDPAKIVFDADETSRTGDGWIKPFDAAYTDATGALHVKGKQLRVDWNNKLYAMMPDRIRGTLYCHLIAPEYAKRLMTGAVTAPPPSAE